MPGLGEGEPVGARPCIPRKRLGERCLDSKVQHWHEIYSYEHCGFAGKGQEPTYFAFRLFFFLWRVIFS